MGDYFAIKKPLQAVKANAANDWNEAHPVVVIGAGAAGMSAACTLKFLKVPVKVLEANPTTVGGRVQRNEEFLADDGIPLDIGAEWIHTKTTDVLKDIVIFEEDLEEVEKIDTILYKPKTWSFYNFGGVRRFDRLHDSYEENKFKKTSWSQYIEKVFYKHIKDDIELDATVKQIDYSDDSTIKITLTNGKIISASKVICAAPLSKLVNESITFVPELPKDKKSLLKKTFLRPGFKLAIEFSERFYTDVFYDHSFLENTFRNATQAGADRMYFDVVFGKETKKNVVGVYAYGNGTKDMADLDDDKLLEAILKRFDKMYDGKPSKLYVRHIVKNWTKDPYIEGGFSNNDYAVEMEKEFGLKPVEDKVFFAGEHVAGYLSPTVQGAALSGRRAAMNAVGKPYKY